MKGGGRSYTNYTKPIGNGNFNSDNDDCSSINFITELQNINSAIKKVA